MKFERNVLEPHSSTHVAQAQSRFGPLAGEIGLPPRSRRRGTPTGCGLALLRWAEHELDDALLSPGLHVDDADRFAITQDRCPVTERGDLQQAV